MKVLPAVLLCLHCEHFERRHYTTLFHSLLRSGVHSDTTLGFHTCSIANDEKVLKDERTAPHVVVGTPGRILALCSPEKGTRALDLSKVKHFVLDECDKVLDSLGMFFLSLADW